jgi:hypothetical protein
MRIIYLLLAAFLLVGCGRSVPAVTLNPTGAAESGGTNQAPPSSTNLSQDADSEVGFRFTDDRGGKLLASLLPPTQQQSSLPSDRPTSPAILPTPRNLERITLPLPTSEAQPPRSIPSVRPRSVRPRAVPDGLPLADYRAAPVLPEHLEMPACLLAREWSPDVEAPVNLPILAQKAAESSSTDDATGEVTTAAALATVPPQRATPAPFLRMTVPDPFEHRKTVRLQKELPEAAQPLAGAR